MAGAWTAPKTMGAEPGVSADWNTHVRDNLDYLKTHIALGDPALLEILAGVVTVVNGYNKIETAGGIPTDDLDTIGGGLEGMLTFIRAHNAAHDVVLKHGTGNLLLGGGDITLDDTEKLVILFYGVDANWHLVNGPYVTRTFPVNAFQYPAPGTDWTPQLEGAGLGASLVAKICTLPINFLKHGDEIISYNLTGDATEAAALTLDCQLVSVNLADPITHTDIAGGAIVQVAANGNFDVLATLTNPEVVVTDKQYTFEITGTTGVGDEIIVMGAEVVIRRQND